MAAVRKRSATETELEREPVQEQSTTFGEQLKRNRASDELEGTQLVPKDEAWIIDVEEMVPALREASIALEAISPFPSNFRNYDPTTSLFVICVIGSLQIHYSLLCNNLTTLFGLSRNIQVLALSLYPQHHLTIKTADATQICLPGIQAVGPSHNYFGKLGLLQPSGGGQAPLDAIVILDAQGRRRLVLPVGWGAGKYVTDGAGGKMVQDKIMTTLRKAIQVLEKESKGTI